MAEEKKLSKQKLQLAQQKLIEEKKLARQKLEESAKKLIDLKIMTAEQIADITGLPIKTIKQLEKN